MSEAHDERRPAPQCPGQAERPWVLCLSGLDPRGAAGLLRDTWAIDRAGGTPLGVVTALTMQSRTSFDGAMPPPHGSVVGALRSLTSERQPDAVKIGLLVTPATIVEMRPFLSQWAREDVPIVIDPIQAPSAGGYSAGGELRAGLFEWLTPLGAHWTPNRPELQWLGEDPRLLLEHGAASVFVKGGHGRRDSETEILDELHTLEGVTSIRHPRQPGPGRRGTGCTLSALFALELARGKAVEQAAKDATHSLQSLWGELVPA
jgi:hydroxymethylpyrimidine/phosphomethylpyrimidine kinase